ncbi:MAG: molybdopterin molybdenumtransferase MoeA, partial [Pseudomonadota bacterium]|nr:molybdopterin molybdenumtransferase MoeA [Pseudomonadota bacterium]
SIYALQGYKHEDFTMNMILGENLPENRDRKHYMRARVAYTKEGNSIVIPLANQDSASLKNLSESDVLIIREPNVKKARAGSEIKVIPIK